MPYSGMDLIQAYLDLDSETVMNIAAEMDGRGKMVVSPSQKNGKSRRGQNRHDPKLFKQSLGFMDEMVAEVKAIAYDQKVTDSQEVRLSRPGKTEGYRRLVYNGMTIGQFRANRNGQLRVFWEATGGSIKTVYISHSADIHEVAQAIVETEVARSRMKIES